ncbi:MAG: cytochrome c/FTR1 family iron permease [Bacteriovorax sp.]|nr:cytochrome c/FTR1 family iron permease [Bacteriovorax sp.]
MLKFTLILAILFSLQTSFALSQTPLPKNPESSELSPRFAIHLLDYLAHDYAGAVIHGKVASVTEYAEQKEFVTKIFELAGTLPEIKDDKKTYDKIVKLKSMIESKAEAIDVALQSRDIQKDLISITKIKLAPTNQPSLTNGKLLYEQSCVTCHGQNGLGDGPNATGLEPAPANFHNSERMSAISAFHVYNTIRLGVPGTGMIAWSNFSDKEVWDLSFYVMSLRHAELAKSQASTNIISTDSITLEEAATLSDTELKEKFNEKDENKKNLALALLRNKNDNTSGGQFVGKAKSYLSQALSAYKSNSKNSKQDAKRLALQAYLEGIEPIEPMIKANNPLLVAKIETQMGKIRQIISDPKGSVNQLSAQIIATQDIFSEVEETIQAKELSFGVAFSGAFAIILREGFEAVLIILTLLSVIKAFGSRKAALWVHAGWGSALFLGFVAWFLSGTLMKMSGASREVLEAVTSAVAVVILLYFGFWLHRQTEISRWKKFIHEKVQGAMDNKNLFGLFSIAFISVFREAFETVLFIRALWFQTNTDGKNAIAVGLIAALVLIFSFSFIALRYSKKLPVRELFKVSSIMTSILAFILAGKAVHSMQEAGILNITTLPWNIRFDTIGLFPTWQTISAQVLTFVLAMVLININTTKAAVVNNRV